MRKSLLAVCALLASCGGVKVEAVDRITPLEQACLRDPLDAGKWDDLAAALAIGGQRERAASMYLQAASLRAHDVRQDYATLKQARDEAIAEAMPRTLVRRAGPALMEVVRTDTVAGENAAPPVRLEISNGNGVAGAAARLARALDADGLKTVRLSNMRPFVVPLSRIEYQQEQKAAAQALGRLLHLPLQQRSIAYADLRIVLGHDARYLR